MTRYGVLIHYCHIYQKLKKRCDYVHIAVLLRIRYLAVFVTDRAISYGMRKELMVFDGLAVAAGLISLYEKFHFL